MKTTKKIITGSEALVLSLLSAGTEVIFGYPGGAIMPVYDALYDYKDKLRHILVRHEQGASHAAEGYARLSGKPGVCIATSGPGATNLVTGIADAMLDSIPLVCITGQVASHLVGSDAFQEVDVIGITTPITKWNYQISDAKEIPNILAKAFYIATHGRPGPVLVDITKDAQLNPTIFSYAPYTPTYLSGKNTQFEKNIKDAAVLLNNARKPYILIGHGVLISGAEKELLAIAEKAQIPMASTLLGLSAVSVHHPLYVGMLGMHGNYAPNVLTNKADVILAVGMRFDDRVTGQLADYAKQAKIIHIDIDKAEFHKNVIVDIELHADAKPTLQALLPHLKKNAHDAWIKQFHSHYQEEYKKVIKYDMSDKVGEKMKMAEVVKAVSDITKGKAVIVADVGQHQMTSARYYEFDQPNSYLTSGGAGTMGYALPASIGAKIAAPTREVIAIIGDGCFQMTIQELGTLAQENLAVKIIILNNNFLGMVRQWQEMFFDKRYSFVELENPDFIQVAKAYGIAGERITKRAELASALKRMREKNGPYILDIHVEKETNVFPMVATGASVSEMRLE